MQQPTLEEVPDQVVEVSSSKREKQESAASEAGDADLPPVKEKRGRSKKAQKKDEVTEEDAPKEASKKADKPKKRSKGITVLKNSLIVFFKFSCMLDCVIYEKRFLVYTSSV